MEKIVNLSFLSTFVYTAASVRKQRRVEGYRVEVYNKFCCSH